MGHLHLQDNCDFTTLENSESCIRNESLAETFVYFIELKTPAGEDRP